MFAVIFKARIKQLDDEYYQAAQQMRELAINLYGCVDFTSLTEGNEEISISYWKNEQQIEKWKQDPEHRAVQLLGQTRWYDSYQVEVVEVIRKYSQK